MNQEQQRYKVEQLPFHEGYFKDGYQQYAGDMEILPKVNYFFWLFRNQKPKDKLLIWLNGGPGCTSADGPLLERGILDISPTTKEQGYDIKVREKGWHTFADVIALDQPLGTGYSHGPEQFYSKSIEDAAYYFEKFIEKLLETFPEYKNVQVYIGGESYAGVWIPTFATRLLKNKQDLKLKGLMIGNGWIDSINQFNGLLDFVGMNNLLNEEDMANFREKSAKCQTLLRGKINNPISNSFCDELLNDITLQSDKSKSGEARNCINLYDMRLQDKFPDCGMGWPPNVQSFRSYMAEVKVSEALHAHQPKDGWTECNNRVQNILKTENVESTINLLPDLLDKLEILLFVGDQDIMINYLGIDYTVGNMTFLGKKGVDDQFQTFGTKPNLSEGELKQRGSLSYAKLYNGSHMVSYDLPDQTSSLLNWFMTKNDNNKSDVLYFNIGNNRGHVGPIQKSAPVHKESGLPAAAIGIISIAGFIIILGIALIIIGIKKNKKQSVDDIGLLQHDNNE